MKTQTEGSANREGNVENANARGAQPGTMSFDVKHDHFFGSDRGRLMITPDSVAYESVSDVNNSRQWNLSGIKEIDHDGPYKLTIVPFTGDKYNFNLLGKGITPDEYQALVNRVTSARLSRK